MTVLETRAPTRGELERFYGHPVPCTVRASALFVDGEPVAIGGIAYERGMVKLFMDWTDDAVRYPVALVKACRACLAAIRSDGRHQTLYAVTCSETARRFLSRLGFEPHSSAQNGEVYQWRS